MKIMRSAKAQKKFNTAQPSKSLGTPGAANCRCLAQMNRRMQIRPFFLFPKSAIQPLDHLKEVIL